MKLGIAFSMALVLITGFGSFDAHASRWEIRQEIREGIREVNREKREAAREVLSCKTRHCVRREIREGHREVAREKREARREIKRAIRNNKHHGHHKDHKDFVTGALIGGAIVGTAVAIANNSH